MQAYPRSVRYRSLRDTKTNSCELGPAEDATVRDDKTLQLKIAGWCIVETVLG